MTLAAERSALVQAEAPVVFDAARYTRLLELGHEAADSQGLASLASLHELDADPEFEGIMRASLTTVYAQDTAEMLNRLVAPGTGSTRTMRAYGMRIVYGDRGAALMDAIDQQPGTPAGDSLTELLANVYRTEGSSPPHLVPALHRHLPGRVLRTCAQYDALGVAIPEEDAGRMAGQLYMLSSGLGKDDAARQGLAEEMLAATVAREKGSATDAVMRKLLLGDSALAQSLYDILKIDKQFPIKKLWQAGYDQDLLPNNKPDPKSMAHKEYMELNAQRVIDIERLRPGGVRLLARRFTIKNIGRVPEDWLLDLIDMDHSQYGRILLAGVASRCGNGAMMQGMETLNEIRKKLPPGMTIIPMEVARPTELQEQLELLERARKIYGSTTKIVGATMEGHGSTEGRKGDEIELSIIYGSRSGHGESLTTHDIAGAVGSLLDRLLEPEAPTVVISCSMAKDGNEGWCATLFKRLRREVIGMRETAGLRQIDIIMRRGSSGVRLKPQFRRRVAESPTKWKGEPSRAKYFRPRPRTAKN